MKEKFTNLARLFIFFAICITLSFSLSPDSLIAKRKISLTPGLFEFSAPPGAEVSNTFLVKNEGDKALSHVFVYATNVEVNKEGKEIYELPRPEESIINSPASWIYVKVPDPTKILGNIPFLSVNVNEEKRVQFVIKIPEKTPPGDYTLIVFFETREMETGGKTATSVGARVGCRIKIRVQGEIIEDISINSLKINRFSIGGTIPYEFSLVNNGNVDAPGSLKVYLSTLGGSKIYKKTIQKNTYLYAKSKLDYTSAIKSSNQGLGLRNFSVVFDYKNAAGKNESIKVTKKYFAIPLYFFYMCLIVLAGGVLFISFYLDSKLRKRGKAFEKED